MTGKQSGDRLQIEMAHPPDCLEAALFMRLVPVQAGDGARLLQEGTQTTQVRAPERRVTSSPTDDPITMT